jgi:hypothetical protein
MRAIISKSASDPRKIVGQIDIKKAHLYGVSTRKIAVRLPNGSFGFLLRTLYGTRDAASSWEHEVRRVMLLRNLVNGKASPCLYKDEVKDCALLIHGDDIIFSGFRKDFEDLAKHLSQHWNLTVKGCVGRNGTVSSLRVLGRLLSYNPKQDTFELEADPRHAEILSRLADRCFTTPGEKPVLASFDSTKLNEADSSNFRSLTMRAAYLGLDRPEINYAIVQLARSMANPTVGDWKALKRLCSFLRGAPRLVQTFVRQPLPEVLTVYTDADFAGDERTRKSTTGIANCLGYHSLSVVCKTQSVIALSSGESEFYALGSAAQRGLGLVSLLEDLGIYVSLEVHSDSSAAKGTSGRVGLGKAKHISTAYLWLQVAIRDQVLTVKTVKGDDNVADLMTKHLASPRIFKLLSSLGFHRRDGSHELALKAS